jgi:hypothetical protein
MTMHINEELISKMSPEDQKKVREYAAQQQAEFEKREAEAQRQKEEAALRKYPTLKSIFDRIKGKGTNYSKEIKRAVLKRTHICLTYLRMPEDMMEFKADQITLDFALLMLGRVQAINMMVEDIGRILQDAFGYSLIRVYPREMVQLRELSKKQAELAQKLVWSVTFQMVKKEGTYEPKAEVPAGESVSG